MENKALISILIPTKNRTENISRVLKSLQATTSESLLSSGGLEVVFYVDNDDQKTIEHLWNAKSLTHENITILWCTTDEKVLFSDMWNQAFQKSTGTYVMLCGDDVEFLTQDWDVRVLETFKAIPDNVAYVATRDGYQNGNIGVHGFVHRKWVELVGFFTPPYFAYWYADTWLDEVSKSINRFVYLNDVEVIHYHPATENSRGIDDVYKENEAKITPELISLYESKKDERDEHAKILLSYIDSLANPKKEVLNLNQNKTPEKKLSILICSIFDREKQFKNLLESLNKQIKEDNLFEDVEILYEIDDAKIPIGKKRNSLLKNSCGEYVVFIDDDDTVHKRYVSIILAAIEGKPDCVGFRGKIFWKKEYYDFNNSINNKEWSCDDINKRMFDNISHINPIKRSIATSYAFPDKFWGEDKGWLDNVRTLVKTQTFLYAIMYHYTPSQQDLIKQEKDKKITN